MKNKPLTDNSEEPEFKESSSLHQLRFYPKAPFVLESSPPPASDDSEEATYLRMAYEAAAYKALNPITQELFGLSLSDFVTVRQTTIGQRKVANGFSYQDKILLLISRYKTEMRLSIEINGSAFDTMQLDWENLYSCIDAGYIVTDIHAKIDTLATPFRELWHCWKHESVTSSCRKKTDFDSTTKTMIFGSDSRIYQIYQAGWLHCLPYLDTVRHEVQLSKEYARQFWELFRLDSDDLGALVKSTITGTFKVKFRKNVNDDNRARRPLLSSWKEWLADTSPSYLRHQLKPTQVSNSVQRVIKYLLRARNTFDQQQYDYVLGQVELLHMQSHPSEPIIFE